MMPMARNRLESHRSGRARWLRAAVLGADDGIVSTASLMIGVAAANAPRSAIVLAGLAGLGAGAMAMATGEYVSVSSQLDAERADIAMERRQLARDPAAELAELTELYIRRGLEPELAGTVAERLTASDPVDAHLREELGFRSGTLARPVEAALASALSFAIGAALPLLVVALAPTSARIAALAIATAISLAGLGMVGARMGGASPLRAALRVTVGGVAAMAVTASIGRAFGAIGQ
jgi:VIT1/CCC1 family predicted Fe2+/Mn2+ transporter